MPRPHWSLFQQLVSVEPDWEPLHRAVAETLDAEVEESSPPNKGEDFYTRMEVVLTAHAGPWYGAATRAGDEMLREWCWSHTPWKGWGQRPISESLQFAVDSIVGEVQACFAWHHAIAETIGTIESTEDEPKAIARVITALIDRIVELRIHDDWYNVIVPVLAWVLERDGYTVTEVDEGKILVLVSRDFSSGVVPSSDTRREFAESAAVELLDRELAQRYPDDAV